MAKFRFLKNINLGGGKRTTTGDIVDEADLPAVYIKQWLALGHMVPHDETEIKAASVEVEHRDPQPKKKRGRARKGS